MIGTIYFFMYKCVARNKKRALTWHFLSQRLPNIQALKTLTIREGHRYRTPKTVTIILNMSHDIVFNLLFDDCIGKKIGLDTT
jgi:hypothetical protein